MALGERPAGMQYFPRGDVDAITVVASADAPGGRCLRFQDRPDFANRYDPHAVVRLNHESGTSVGEFSLLIDSRSDFVHEWRDDAKPYRVGPSLRVGAQGVMVAGRIVAPTQVGEWMHFRIVAPLGAAAGKWRLEIRDARGKTRVIDDLANTSPSWGALRWSGFISDSAVRSTACVADVRFYSKLN